MADDEKEFVLEEVLSKIDPSLVDKWGDPNKHPETQLSKEQIQMVIDAGREVFLSHITKDGFPMVTPHVYCLIDGVIWSTTVRGRVKEKAYRRDPRCALCISTSGLNIPVGGGITIKARAEIVEDRAIIEKVCREHGERYYSSPRAKELFFGTLFTPNRLAIKFHIDHILSWANIGVRQG